MIYTAQEFSTLIQSGTIKDIHKVNDIITVEGTECRIIGINHDRSIDNPTKHTVTLMPSTLLPAREYHRSGRCENGWKDSDLRRWLNEEHINTLPAALVEIIQSVKKRTHNYNGRLRMTTDKLFALSESELIGSAYWSPKEDGKRYKAFSDSGKRMMKDTNGDYRYYWTRSAYRDTSTSFVNVYTEGTVDISGASNTTLRVSFGFTVS